MAEACDVTLRLGDMRHLFEKPELSPLEEDYQEYSYTSGIEFIAGELYAHPSRTSVTLTILLPADKTEMGLEIKAEDAVRRYCTGKLKDIDHDIRASRWRGVRTLLAAFVAWFVFIGVSRFVRDENSLLLQIIGEGLAVAGWVALWFPLDVLMFTVWQHRLEKRIYTTLLDMEVIIQPEVRVSGGFHDPTV